ncbi:hypothetical protein DVH05_026982 [Phytophthora capsici]|nr:hypothetical protein DVH05_026982 [Phytophthora capsici]
MMVDFWSSKSQPGKKFLGLRVYLIDNQWQFESILLGTRCFEPLYGERSEGYRAPFKRWIIELLQNFSLTVSDFFAATTDAGPDVKWMMRTGLSLKWVWCMSHLTNAATKTAFGIVAQRSASKNVDATDLISRIVNTVYAIRSNESMGSLFAKLCTQLQLGGASQLLAFKEHRFMGLTRVIRRILETWGALELWFEDRRSKAIRARKVPPQDFPLIDDKMTLTQLLALLDPITTLNIRAQGECANQVEILLSLYRIRLTVLDEATGIKDRLRSALKPPLFHRVHELTPIVKRARHLLAAAFQMNFFSRYTDRAIMRETTYIPEAQMCLHRFLRTQTKVCQDSFAHAAHSSSLTRPNPICASMRIQFSATSTRSKSVSVSASFLSMVSVAAADASSNQRRSTSDESFSLESLLHMSPPPIAYSEELTNLFGENPAQRPQQCGHEARVEEELDRWLADTVMLERMANGESESVLDFWKRQEETNAYNLLPRVARILYAVPSSSAAIERDFGVNGMMVTAQRSSLSNHNIEMCSFLNRNRQFTDITECKALTDEEYTSAIPSSMLVDLNPGNEDMSTTEWQMPMFATLWGDSCEDESKMEIGSLSSLINS